MSMRRLLLAAGLLGLLTVGDGFVYLVLQSRSGFAAQWFPLLYVGTNAAYLALAIPFGRLADRSQQPKSLEVPGDHVGAPGRSAARREVRNTRHLTTRDYYPRLSAKPSCRHIENTRAARSAGTSRWFQASGWKRTLVHWRTAPGARAKSR